MTKNSTITVSNYTIPTTTVSNYTISFAVLPSYFSGVPERLAPIPENPDVFHTKKSPNRWNNILEVEKQLSEKLADGTVGDLQRLIVNEIDEPLT